MINFIIEVYDFKDIQRPKKINEFNIEASSKSDAIDQAHTLAEEAHPEVNRYVEVRMSY